MITREQTDAKITKIRTGEYPEDVRQDLIDKALTLEADQVIPENEKAIAQAFFSASFLAGLLVVVKYGLLPLILL